MAETNFIPKIKISSVQEIVKNDFLIGNNTYLEDVFYLDAFESLWIDLQQNTVSIMHHQPVSFDMPDREEEIIQQFDKLFSEAVNMQFRKNAEYGYRQCLTLSGGMDSRACLLKAVELGYNKDILCFNYAQAGSIDYKVSLEIARDLGLDYLFYPMDAAVFVDRLDENMRCNDCQQGAIGSTGARTMACVLDTSNFGIINIAICGGELMGDLIFEKGNGIPVKLRKLLNFHSANATDYIFDPQMLLDNLRGSQNTAYMFIDKCECISPFMDEDVFMFVSQISPVLLANRSLYKKWMMQYIPNSYPITHWSGSAANTNALRIIFSRVVNKIQKEIIGFGKNDMNPIDYWFSTQDQHAKRWTEEYIKLCNCIENVDRECAVLAIAKSCWGQQWEKNINLVTALRAIKDIYTVFGKIR